MQKAMKRMQLRGLPEAALTLFALCASLLLGSTHGAECEGVGSRSLPCTFGDCEFDMAAGDILYRKGSCPTKTGILFLDNRLAPELPMCPDTAARCSCSCGQMRLSTSLALSVWVRMSHSII